MISIHTDWLQKLIFLLAILKELNTGEGIPEPYQARIFDQFFRVPGSNKGGAGLGLSICREIIDAHGGHRSG
ncbi:MAG: hypothetical protein HQM03_03810 [Magnetococcales bacterium]|nr:hypothetical protein [Magnetococcales bacterium]